MSVVDEVKDRLDVVEIIQSYVPLKKAGRNYKGLCPFHAEKTPSFVVFPDSGTWHCFGACATGGDIFTFVMKRENLSFGEALQMLARRAGVEVKPITAQASAEEQRQALLREINQSAATYFHHLLLQSDEAAHARTYLQKRGLNQATLDQFEVGYALDQWDGLIRHLTSKRYSLADVAEAGLAVERDDQSGYYDRFRGRIIFSIRDLQGQTVGFGGRAMGDAQPKYLNSPQTLIFDKSSILFGLDQARQAIRQAREAVIVEGYMDVLMAHQHGIANVVAQMGTALTEAQLKLLKRYTQRFVLALDPDTAGDQATLRGLDVARQVADREIVPVPTPQGLIHFEERLAADIHIASLPAGLDPDEVIRQDPAHWTELISQARPIVDYYFQALTAGLDLSEASGKAEAVKRLGPILIEIGNRVQRTHYLQKLARLVQVDERTLAQQIGPAAPAQRSSRRTRPRPETSAPKRNAPALDEYCLALFLTQPALLTLADKALQADGTGRFGVEDLSRSEDRVLLNAWREWLEAGRSADVRAEFYDSLEEPLQLRVSSLVSTQDGAPLVPDELLRDDIADAVTRLRLRNLQHEIEQLRFMQEEAGDSTAAAAYAPLIRQGTTRIRALEKAMTERSVAGRRQQIDAAVRTPFTE